MLYNSLYGAIVRNVKELTRLWSVAHFGKFCVFLRKWPQGVVDEADMVNLDASQFFLIAVGTVVMALVTLRAIAQGSFVVAVEAISERRAVEAKRHAENAEAEAAGRAAALEPLSLNADGTIEEPIIGVVEKP